MIDENENNTNFNDENEAMDNDNINVPQENDYMPRNPESDSTDQNEYQTVNPFIAYNSYEEYKNKRLNNGTRNFLILICLTFAFLLLFLAGYLLYFSINKKQFTVNDFLSSQLAGSQSSSQSEQYQADPNAPSIQIENLESANGKMSASEIYKKLSPSIVGVVTYNLEEGIEAGQKGEGSGIIISKDGYIVTNSHVIGDTKSYGVKVVLNNNEEYSAKVIGYDVRTDLAVIKADAEGLTEATFGNSDQLEVGQDIIAIGNPGGLDFAGSLTMGVVSALNRTLSSSSLVKYIQTDAAISPGNSGGALINMYGQVIGINTVKVVSTGYEGMGFAIPINTAKSTIDDIISQGYVSGRVRLGITGKVVSEYQARMYDVPQGILIAQIAQDSSLAASTAQVGDIIVKIDSCDVVSFDSLYSELTKHKPADTVTLTLYRPSSLNKDNSTFEISVTLLEDKGETQN